MALFSLPFNRLSRENSGFKFVQRPQGLAPNQCVHRWLHLQLCFYARFNVNSVTVRWISLIGFINFYLMNNFTRQFRWLQVWNVCSEDQILPASLACSATYIKSNWKQLYMRNTKTNKLQTVSMSKGSRVGISVNPEPCVVPYRQEELNWLDGWMDLQEQERHVDVRITPLGKSCQCVDLASTDCPYDKLPTDHSRNRMRSKLDILKSHLVPAKKIEN